MSAGGRDEERRKLADIIHHWNANRLDLFEISQPTEVSAAAGRRPPGPSPAGTPAPRTPAARPPTWGGGAGPARGERAHLCPGPGAGAGGGVSGQRRRLGPGSRARGGVSDWGRGVSGLE